MRGRLRVSKARWPSRARAFAPVTFPAAVTCPMPIIRRRDRRDEAAGRIAQGL